MDRLDHQEHMDYQEYVEQQEHVDNQDQTEFQVQWEYMDRRENARVEQHMCVGVVSLVQTLEQNQYTRADQEEHVIIKEEAVTHNVYRQTLTTTRQSMGHRFENAAYMYGAEYEGTNGLVGGTQDTDVPCTVCYVPTRSTVYMIPAKYTCPKGWTREYFGYLMSQHNTHRRSQFTCVEESLKSANNSSWDQNGVLFYPVGVCGSLPCPPYEQTKELSCAVCTRQTEH